MYLSMRFTGSRIVFSYTGRNGTSQFSSLGRSNCMSGVKEFYEYISKKFDAKMILRGTIKYSLGSNPKCTTKP